MLRHTHTLHACMHTHTARMHAHTHICMHNTCKHTHTHQKLSTHERINVLPDNAYSFTIVPFYIRSFLLQRKCQFTVMRSFFMAQYNMGLSVVDLSIWRNICSSKQILLHRTLTTKRKI